MAHTIKEKYKTELLAVNKYIDNSYIYKIFYDYGFTINNKFIPLHSNINVYEACFISQLCNIYISKNKNKTLNILEIGLAYGTSSLILINQLLQFKNKKLFDIIDPNQSTQWNSIGLENIKLFLKFMNSKLKINLYEESSVTAIPKFKKKYDIIFIDGSHTEDIVILDLINSNNKLKINGLIIIDDVLHSGVKNALLNFTKKFSNYNRISIKNNNFFTEKILYDKTANKKSFDNPKTMFCLQKITI